MPIKGAIFYFFLVSILSIIFISKKLYLLLIALLVIAIIAYKKYGLKTMMALIFTFAFFLFYRVNEKIEVNKNNKKRTKFL